MAVLRVDPSDDSITTFGNLPTDRYKWVGGNLAPNGYIYAVPFSAGTVLKIDPRSDSTAQFGNVGGHGNLGWVGVFGSPAGLTFGLPYDSDSVLQIGAAGTCSKCPAAGKHLSTASATAFAPACVVAPAPEPKYLCFGGQCIPEATGVSVEECKVQGCLWLAMYAARLQYGEPQPMLLRRQPAVLQLQPVVLHGLPWQRLVCLTRAIIVMVDYSPARLARQKNEQTTQIELK